MSETNCAFQYAKMRNGFYKNTEIVCDKSGLTIDEARQLWNQHYSDCAKWIKDGGSCEMVIWINMPDDYSYQETEQYISTDAESDGVTIWETVKNTFKKY